MKERRMNRLVRFYANAALFNLGVKGKIGNKFSLQQVKLQTFTGEFPMNMFAIVLNKSCNFTTESDPLNLIEEVPQENA